MNFKTLGDPSRPAIILIHDAGLNTRQFKEAARLLSRNYYVVLPELSGHGQSQEPFVSIAAEADAIVDYIRRQLHGEVELVGGSGLGGMVALETVSRMPFARVNLFLDGVSFSEPGRPLIPSAFLRYRYRSLLRNPRIKEMIGPFPAFQDMEPVFEAMHSYEPPKVLPRKVRARIVYGAAENKGVRQAGSLLLRNLRNSTLDVQEGMGHGDLVLENPQKLSILLYSQLSSLF